MLVKFVILIVLINFVFGHFLRSYERRHISPPQSASLSPKNEVSEAEMVDSSQHS